MFIRQPALGAVALSLGLAAAASASAQPPAWPVTPGKEAGVCLATGPADGPDRLSLVLQNGAYTFLLLGPDMPQAQGDAPVIIGFDGQPPIADHGFAVGGGVIFLLGADPSVRGLLSARTVQLAVAGHAHSFPLAGAGESLDALARCAGQPPLGH